MVKQLLLWAALAYAFAPSAFAQNAKTAKPLTNAMLAIDYLERELGARLTPLPGKAFLPAQASKNQYSPEQLAAVRAVFGSASPLQVKRLPPAQGRNSYSITLPAGQYQDGKEDLSWEQGSLTAGGKPDGSVTMRGQMPSLRFAEKMAVTSLKGLRFESSLQRSYWAGQSEVAADKIVVTPTEANGVSGSFEDLRQSLQIKREGKDFGGRLDLTIGRFLVAGHGVENVRLTARLRQLDRATLNQLQKEALAQQAKGGPGRDSFDVLTRHLPALKRLAMRGATLDLEQFSLAYKGHELAIRGSLAMPQAGEADFAAARTVLQKLNGKLEVAVPLPLLRQIANDIAASATAGKGKHELSPEELGARIYEKEVGDLIANRYAWREKDMLLTTLELQDGLLKVNGQAVPLERLLAPFKKESTSPLPPADHSEPQVLTMRGRGLEVAQVFALNGNAYGMFDLCERYLDGIGVPADGDEGSKWCEKAMAKGSEMAVLRLARRQLEGRYDGDFKRVLDKLKTLADAAQSAEAQFLMSRFTSDSGEAANYLRRAAAGGYPEALDKKSSNASPWQLDMSAPGGYYATTAYRFDSKTHRRLRLSLDDIKKHEKWGSMASVCLESLMPSDGACLRLHGADDGKVAVYALLVAKGGTSKQERKLMERRVAPGEAIDLALHTDGYKAYFIVNGEPPLLLDIGFPAEVLNLACSGGACRADFQRAPE